VYVFCFTQETNLIFNSAALFFILRLQAPSSLYIGLSSSKKITNLSHIIKFGWALLQKYLKFFIVSFIAVTESLADQSAESADQPAESADHSTESADNSKKNQQFISQIHLTTLWNCLATRQKQLTMQDHATESTDHSAKSSDHSTK
jgi:hypothetical protein